MNDTRAKLETLFRRLVDPAVSDLDALSDFVWFRKLALSGKDIDEVLGTLAPADDGPMWPFKKKHAGGSSQEKPPLVDPSTHDDAGDCPF